MNLWPISIEGGLAFLCSWFLIWSTWWVDNILPVRNCQINESIKNIKCLVNDLISAILLKSNLDWWAAFLASLFIHISNSFHICNDWNLPLAISLFKKITAQTHPIIDQLVSSIFPVNSIHTSCFISLSGYNSSIFLLMNKQAFRRLDQPWINVLACSFWQRNICMHTHMFPICHFYLSKISISFYIWKKLLQSSLDQRFLFLIRILHDNTIT